MDRELTTSRVECHSGYSACDYPTSVWFEGQQYKVIKIEAEWREPGSKVYHLLTNRTLRFEARYFE